jgi:shikimate kinase
LNIFLIGPRGSGKSTVARLLAARLGWGLVDADAELERRAALTIREVFDREGEAGFRERESAVLADLCRGERQVIATGGGVVLRADNRARLRAGGWVVWLTDAAVVLRQRLMSDTATAERRPSLTGAGAVALEEIEQVLRQRLPLYEECADVALTTGGRTPEEVADAVLAAWRARQGEGAGC